MRVPAAKIAVEWIDITTRNVIAFTAMVAIAVALAIRWFRGSSVFGFESPYWDLGLIPILAALVTGAIRLTACAGTGRRFVLGFEVFGWVAVTAYFLSCSQARGGVPCRRSFHSRPDSGWPRTSARGGRI